MPFIIGLMILLPAQVFATSELLPAAPGDTVEVFYALSFPGGPVFESNDNKTPFVFTLGTGAVIAGFDDAVRGMVPGEKKTVIIPLSRGYGEKNENLIREIPLSEATEIITGFNKSNVTISLIPGYPCPLIEYLPPEGKRERYLFTNIKNETVTLDTNRPLVGKDLEFTITLNRIVSSA
ncbi:MAG: FKBP-type peptidyl-prolyl cis-trans isomerase [Methanospirillaceae archaeon]|nr:FKBP-type peptidyl-prolyl cis-trans isomerase [Methanospirillaceae archaeon]